MKTLNQIKNFVFDLIFPIKCLGCGAFSKEYLCESCKNSIVLRHGFTCIFCDSETDSMPSNPYLLNEQNTICDSHRKTIFLNFCLSATNYQKQPVVHSLIHALKYKFIKDTAKIMGVFLITYLKNIKNRETFNFTSENSLIIPVPIHPKRLRWRGFNQTDAIALPVSKFLKIPLNKNILTRTAFKKPQIKIRSKAERKKNVENSFHCKKTKKIKGKTIILIDDMVTTGSTLNECAKVLKQNGAEKVIGLTFARR